MPAVLSPASKRALVAPGDLSFAMARMFELLRAGTSSNVRVFRDYDEARSWATSEPVQQD